MDFLREKKILAPLVGGSDLSFRLLCRKYGAEVTYTEMCIAEYYLGRSGKKVKNYTFEFHPSDKPLVAQLAGDEPEDIIELANHEMFKGKIAGVDLNCGCPQGFAMTKGIGSAMFRKPDKLVALCERLVKEIPYPVSVKLRLHDDVETTISIMKRLKEVGVVAFTIHGRFWWMKGEKRGLCDWEAIRRIREVFPDVPIVGNGDVKVNADFAKFKSLSNVDGIMVGYGALKDPSLFGQNKLPVNVMIQDYIDIARNYQNRFIDILRHIMWMLKGSNYNESCTKEVKANLFKCNSMEEVVTFFATLDPPIIITFPPGPHKIDFKGHGVKGKRRLAKEKRIHEKRFGHLPKEDK